MWLFISCFTFALFFVCFSECVSVGVVARVDVGVGVGVAVCEFSQVSWVLVLLLQNFFFANLIAI